MPVHFFVYFILLFLFISVICDPRSIRATQKQDRQPLPHVFQIISSTRPAVTIYNADSEKESISIAFISPYIVERLKIRMSKEVARRQWADDDEDDDREVIPSSLTVEFSLLIG